MKPQRVSGLLFAGCAAFAVGCASAPAERTHYLLRYDAPPSAGETPRAVEVGLAPVSVAAYLAQPGVVVETGPNEVRPAQAHLWAEPLSDGLTLYLRAAIAAHLGAEVGGLASGEGRTGSRVEVFVEQLHGTMGGDALLVARFVLVSAGGGAPREFRFARSLPLERAGYAALIDAEEQLVDQLAAAIAGALR